MKKENKKGKLNFKLISLLLILALLFTPYSVAAIETEPETDIKINFEFNGGKSESEQHKYISANALTYGDFPTPIRIGYKLTGWYYINPENNSEITEVYTTSAPLEDNEHTLYAQWTGDKHAVKFDGNGGTVKDNSKTVVNGEEYGPLPTAYKKGYTLLGWYTSKAGGIRITDKTIFDLNKNVTLYARWYVSKYKINFDARGGKASKTSKSVTYGKVIGSLPTVTRNGYDFQGWFSAAKDGSKLSTKTVYKTERDKIYYAQWKRKKLTLKFNANRGKVSKKSKSVKYNGSYGSLPKPKRSNYKFKGWYTSKSGGSKLTSSDKVKYTKNKTLYAKWAKKSIVTFEYRNGKKGAKSKKVAYGYKYGTLPTTKRSGYTFTGWFTKSSGGTQVTSTTKVKIKKNIKLYAKWKSNTSAKVMLAPKNSNARPGYKLNFGGVTIHNTGNRSSTADAMNHAKYLQGAGKKNTASWHYCVDESLTTQSIPENEVAWHAGDGRYGYGNSRTIAIEICMNNGGDLRKSTDRAAKLTADILARKGQKVAISNVNVFQHYNHSKKNCPEMLRKGEPYSWATFIKKVNSYL